ncbi:MAG: M56 family metallopeptidase [Erysipelotrichales bacterium]|nr:M56 family metallopeptidase [Erysipelotrichales bacterium]
MIGEIFYWIFNMTIISSFMGAVVLLIRKIRTVPRRNSIFLWIIPFSRMCIPFGISNPYSLLSLVAKFTTRSVTVYDGSVFELTINNALMAADSYFPLTFRVSSLYTVFTWAGSLWLTGCAVCVFTFLVLYIITMREIKDARHVNGNVYVFDKVDSPAVYGILHPKIVLPAVTDANSRKYVLAHENAHIRRHDNLWRIAGFLAASVHWFNPCSWYFLKCFLEDLELACDETVIRDYNGEERKEYAKTLLDSVSRKNLFASAFGGAKVRVRIGNILSYRKLEGFSAVCLSILIAAIIIAMITNPG